MESGHGGEASVAGRSRARLVEYLKRNLREKSLGDCRKMFCAHNACFSSVLKARAAELDAGGSVPENFRSLLAAYQYAAELLDAVIDEIGGAIRMADVQRYPEEEAVNLILTLLGVAGQPVDRAGHAGKDRPGAN